MINIIVARKSGIVVLEDVRRINARHEVYGVNGLIKDLYITFEYGHPSAGYTEECRYRVGSDCNCNSAEAKIIDQIQGEIKSQEAEKVYIDLDAIVNKAIN